MKLTKYEHACFAVEQNGQLLAVDPGNFTSDFLPTSNILAIIVTHEHGDHFDPDMLAAVYRTNPDSLLIAHPNITNKMPDHRSHAVHAGDAFDIGPFSLRFFGGEHAVIHPDIPTIANLGVLINDLLYYPGDSFVRPSVPVDTLLLPVGAPWLKLSEAADFARDIQPRLVIPTHDAVLSNIGKGLADRIIPQLVETITYIRPEEPLNIEL